MRSRESTRKGNFCAAALLVFSTAATALAGGARPAERQTPDAFFAVHFEPRSADARGFSKLVELVKLADSFKVKLTLQFTPSWARMILADPGRVAALRQWQASGHEVAMHHHGASHGWEWDGYTNLSASEWKRARETVYGRSGPPERQIQEMARAQGLGESYFGGMTDYMALLHSLAGQAAILTMTMGPDRKSDWPQDVPYSADNITIMPDGSYAITGRAVGRPEARSYSGRPVREVGMRFMLAPADVELAEAEYAQAAAGDVVGVVTHIEDFAGNPKIAREWMRFLQAKTPHGRHNRTISEIMQAGSERPDLGPNGP